MSNRNQGFDPLSSLFDAPSPEDEFLFEDDEEEEGLEGTDEHVEFTDPVFSPPPSLSAPPPAEELVLNVHTEEKTVSAEEQARIARDLAAKAMLQAAPPAPEMTPEEQARIARDLAMKAMQRAKPPEPEMTPAEQARIARDLVMKAMQKAAPPPTPASRLAGLASPGQKPMSALEAARAAAAREQAEAPAEPAVTPEEQARIARDLAMKAMQRAKPPEPEVSAEDQVRIARDLAMKAMQRAKPPEPEMTPEEQARIARDLAMKAMQRAKPPEPEVSAEEQARIARDLAMKAMQKAAPPPTPASRLAGLASPGQKPMSALEAARAAAAREEAERAAAPAEPEMTVEEQARIARDLAMKAMQRAKPPEPEVSAEEQVRIARELAMKAMQQAPEAVEEPEEEAVPKTLSDRARKPVTALEAARAAAVAEEKQDVRRQRRRVNKLTAQVRALIPAQLPGLGNHTVANAIVTDQRDVLAALWRAHRTKFLSDGHIGMAVGAAAVLNAFERCPQGQLIAAHVVTDASDYLVWIDMSSPSLLAAFPEARSWFAGG